ncbi:MAG: hypothetical protein AAF654_05025 [Myxococcota bacterium]
MPANATSSERLWGALRTSFNDDVTPGELSLAEWRSLVKPAAEAARDLSPNAVNLLQVVSEWPQAHPAAREEIRSWLANDAANFVPGDLLPIVSEGRDSVFLRKDGVFSLSSDGAVPANPSQMASALYRAAKYVEANFRTQDRLTLFGNAGVTQELKQATFIQLKQALTVDMSAFTPPQKQQLRASIGTLLIDMLRSLPSSGSQAAGLQSKVFSEIHALLADPQTPPSTQHILIGQMQSRDIVAGLRRDQLEVNRAALEIIAPKAPMDYTELARRGARNGKIEINVHDTVGHGEGFLAGFGLNLQRDGWTLVEGSLPRGPARYTREVSANDPSNAWGVPFVVNYVLQYESGNDIYEKMGDPNVDIVAYGGHSNLGRNKLNSLAVAPAQSGAKLILSDSCANADGMDAEYAKFPHAQNLSSNQSTYFRLRQHPEYGKIAYDSEGYHMKMTVLDGIMGKQGWDHIDDELARRANWGHDTPNNWITPNAWQRRFREVDADNDGISDLFDMLPSFNTFDVQTDTAAEFDLVIPSTPADEITANRAFQATRALNSFVNYNPSLADNVWRDVVGDARGLFFQAQPGDTDLVRWKTVESPDGRPAVAVQFSSALADMSVEALRFVLFHEYVVHEHTQGDLGWNVSDEQAKVMALLFAASSLKYDMGWRDREIFDGASKLLNVPAGLTLSSLNRALAEADSQRHNIMGDLQAVRGLEAQFRQNGVWSQLSAPNVGRPTTPARLA